MITIRLVGVADGGGQPVGTGPSQPNPGAPFFNLRKVHSCGDLAGGGPTVPQCPSPVKAESFGPPSACLDL
jgi:hypothetical protein